MTQPAIQVQNLSKQYQLGLREKAHQTFREAIVEMAGAPLRRLRHLSGQSDEEGTFWALRDISFEVPEGEVLGIIGHNGAGKSTLLKILSRITEPTEGRALIHGRVASLLEVGTGFHPELTGRENISLNGAILGMSRAEITRKFDEIVDFSGVEKFLDTPIKRYSSGMKVRLAFAVAAHLEPEILIIDEVLAVGDAEFQRKCLGKMQDVAGHGRTVLFVSHNMAAVSHLCGCVILLDGGQIAYQGSPGSAISHYLEDQEPQSPNHSLLTAPRSTTQRAILSRLELCDGATSRRVNSIPAGHSLSLIIGYEDSEPLIDPGFSVTFEDAFGTKLLSLHTRQNLGSLGVLPAAGTLCCHIPRVPLLPGHYFVTVACGMRKSEVDRVSRAARFEVLKHDLFGTGFVLDKRHGCFFTDASWTTMPENGEIAQRGNEITLCPTT